MTSLSFRNGNGAEPWSRAARPDRRRGAVPPAYEGLRDLAYARALAEASESLLSQADATGLWPAVVTEAATLIPAGTVAAVRSHDDDWCLAAVHDAVGGSADPNDFALTAAVRQGWFDRSRHVDDILLEDAWPMNGADPAASGWRSLLVAEVPCAAGGDRARIAWLSPEPAVFGRYLDVADVFVRHVAAVVRVLRIRDDLEHAAAARQRVGLAQGILMVRYHISPAQAFEALTRRSQDIGVELRLVADEIINGGLGVLDR